MRSDSSTKVRFTPGVRDATSAAATALPNAPLTGRKSPLSRYRSRPLRYHWTPERASSSSPGAASDFVRANVVSTGNGSDVIRTIGMSSPAAGGVTGVGAVLGVGAGSLRGVAGAAVAVVVA